MPFFQGGGHGEFGGRQQLSEIRGVLLGGERLQLPVRLGDGVVQADGGLFGETLRKEGERRLVSDDGERFFGQLGDGFAEQGESLLLPVRLVQLLRLAQGFENGFLQGDVRFDGLDLSEKALPVKIRGVRNDEFAVLRPCDEIGLAVA